MNGYPNIKIHEVCELIVDCVNKTAPKVEEATPWKMLRTPNVRNGRIDTDNCFYVTKETFEKWTRRAKLAPGDTILTREAPVGEVGLVREAEGYFLGQRLMQYRADPAKMDGRFLHYAMRSPFMSQQFHAHGGTGSVVDHLRVPDCKEFLVPFPERPDQEQIASILSALDDKIELNRRMSVTLEDVARSLYRSWFVDFDPVHAKMEGRQPAFMDEATAALFPDRFGDDGLPEGWAVSSIYEVSRVQYGAPFKSSAFNAEKNGRPLVRIRDLKNQQAGVYTTETHPKEYLIQPGDTVVGMDGDFTPYTWCAEPSLMNQRICCFVPLNERDHAFVRLAIPALLKAEEDAAVATTVIHLGKKDIDTFSVVLPPSSILHAFGQRANPLLSKMVAAGIEAKTLAALRDSLLPKLMSGELRVGDARNQIEEVA